MLGEFHVILLLGDSCQVARMNVFFIANADFSWGKCLQDEQAESFLAEVWRADLMNEPPHSNGVHPRKYKPG